MRENHQSGVTVESLLERARGIARMAAERAQSIEQQRRLPDDLMTALRESRLLRILGMPLVGAVVDDRIPSTGEPYPYLHTFFRMGDGACLAFFESPGVPKMPPSQ